MKDEIFPLRLIHSTQPVNEHRAPGMAQGSKMGAEKDGKVGVLLARYFEDDKLPGELPVTFTLKGGDLRGAKLYLLDETHDLTEIPYRTNRAGSLLFSMQANTVIYLELQNEKSKGE